MKHTSIKIAPLLTLILCLFVFESKSKNVEIYVSTKGSDSNSGTQISPVKSLEKAQTLIRLARQNQKNSGITVFVEDGIYPLEKPFVLSSEESGTADCPVIIKASGKAKPIFTGSRELNDWQQLKDETKLNMLPAEAKGNVFVTDLKKQGISDFGNPIEPGNRPELFCNGQLQTLARWPNSDFAKAGLVKGQTQLPPTFKNRKGTKEGIFEPCHRHPCGPVSAPEPPCQADPC